MEARGELRSVQISRLQLNLANPRHEEVEGRDEAMIQLLSNEQVVELARDIVEVGGINPLERMGVFPFEGAGEGEDQFFSTAEGNRRLCALLLLDDPDAVPADMPNRARYVRTFTGLAARIDPIIEVPCVVFQSLDDARPWLERLHNGARDGTGRRRWTPEQQSRNTSDRTNRAATQLRDLAISLRIVTAEKLARTTTTQQRFISNGRFRQAMGVVRLENGSLERTSCWNDFLIMLRHFMADIVTGEINSRSHNSRPQIEEYAQKLESLEGLERRNVPQGPLEQRQEQDADDESFSEKAEPTDDDRTDDQDQDDAGQNLDDVVDDNNGEAGHPRTRPQSAIGEDDQITAALHRLNVQKLSDLYRSLCCVRLPQHTLLAVIGCWSFLESMTRAHGRTENTAFDAYINSQVQKLGVEATPTSKARKFSLTWISNGGNVTKHDWQTAAYDHNQLRNAMDTLKPIVVAMIDDAADQRESVQRAGRTTDDMVEVVEQQRKT